MTAEQDAAVRDVAEDAGEAANLGRWLECVDVSSTLSAARMTRPCTCSNWRFADAVSGPDGACAAATATEPNTIPTTIDTIRMIESPRW